jgi:CheY-like chemotaxis protein
VTAKRILVVEDDADLRRAVAARIHSLGADAVVARTSGEGLLHLGQGPLPSAILLDLRLARVDGAGFLRALRDDANLARIPVITMTNGVEAPAALPDGGPTTHLSAPVDVEELARILVSL